MGTFLRKLYTKKEKKLSGSFWEIHISSEKLTMTMTDDDAWRTTDESSLEKLRCLSAGGAKKLFYRFWENELLNFLKLKFIFLNSKFYKNEKNV